MRAIISILLLFISALTFAQKDTTVNKKLTFKSDFRFRFEQDWNNRNQDGSYKDPRSRFRYRARFGFQYDLNSWAKFGMRIRTGVAGNPQDPQVTIGSGSYNDFGLPPIGFDKLYFKGEWKTFSFSLGKIEYPFIKQNELYFSDNVNPEGLAFHYSFYNAGENLSNSNAGVHIAHFILRTSGIDFGSDSYFSGVQTYWKQDGILLFTGFQFFNDLGNYPDGKETFTQDYLIFQSGLSIKPVKDFPVKIMLDYNRNLIDYSVNDSIASSFVNQKNSLVAAIQYGQLKKKNDFLFLVTYAHMQKYGAIDFLAQNDWTRWSYGNVNSPVGRLTNFHGLEFKVGYMLNDNIKLSSRFFMVEDLVMQGMSHENGMRIRFDIDVKF